MANDEGLRLMTAIANATRRLAFVVATKDRPDDLRTMLRSLAAQSHPVSQVVVVDASTTPVEPVVAEFPSLNIRYLRHWPPSAAGQRNAGVAAVEEGIELVGFLDDDATLEPDAVERMLDFWGQSSGDLGGASFNIMNPIPTGGQRWKRSRLCDALGLYRPKTGQVAPSGWQTVMECVGENCDAQWLATGAVVWRRDVLKKHRLDEYFQGYSYLEDLDFSFTVGKEHRLAIVADAQYHHFPSTGGRIGRYRFGRTEVGNRLYFVRKHGLSVPRCYVALGIRLGLTLLDFLRHGSLAPLSRAAGNLVEIGRNVGPDLVRGLIRRKPAIGRKQ